MYDIYQQSALGVKKCKVNIISTVRTTDNSFFLMHMMTFPSFPGLFYLQ